MKNDDGVRRMLEVVLNGGAISNNKGDLIVFQTLLEMLQYCSFEDIVVRAVRANVIIVDENGGAITLESVMTILLEASISGKKGEYNSIFENDYDEFVVAVERMSDWNVLMGYGRKMLGRSEFEGLENGGRNEKEL